MVSEDAFDSMLKHFFFIIIPTLYICFLELVLRNTGLLAMTSKHQTNK